MTAPQVAPIPEPAVPAVPAGALAKAGPGMAAVILLLQAAIGFLIDSQNKEMASLRHDMGTKMSTEVFSAKMEVMVVKYDAIDERLDSLEDKMDQLLARGYTQPPK